MCVHCTVVVHHFQLCNVGDIFEEPDKEGIVYGNIKENFEWVCLHVFLC